MKKTKEIRRKRNYMEMISENNFIIKSKEIIQKNTSSKQTSLKIAYKLDIKAEYEINNLTYTKKIQKTDLILKLQNIEKNRRII